MTEEVKPVAEATPEPTAAQTTPEVEVAQEQQPEAKTFTQEELDAIVGKRLERERRKLEKEFQKTEVRPIKVEGIVRDQFASDEEYADALAEAKLAKKEEVRKRNEVISAFAEKEEAAIEKYGDYVQVVKSNNYLPITDCMADVIRESDIGPDIAYFLGTNPKEAARISKLSTYLQAKEIGKIESKLESTPIEPKKTSNAPAPITPVRPKNANPSYDLDDPRALKEMGTSAWIEAQRQAQIKKIERQ